MALTLLVEENPKIIEIYQLNLSTYVGLELLVVKSKADALTVIGKQPLKLIICRAKIGSEDVAVPLAEALAEQNLTIPLFVIGHGLYPKIVSGVLPGSLDLKGVIKGSAQALGITAQDMVKKKVEDFIPISAHYFQWINYPVCSVLMRTGSGEVELAFAANEKIDISKVKASQSYVVDKLDRLQMINQITAELVSRLDDKELNPDEQIQAGASNLKMLSRKLMSLGINEETLGLAKKSMVTMATNTKRYPKLGQLLQRMLSNQAGYLFQHTQIVTYVALHIVRNIDWGNPEQEDKITFICFFHDIALENDLQAKIKNKEELRKANFDAREKALVEKHAQLAAELVHKYPHAPMGADQIIRQHHGMLNGLGFSDHFGANLSPMAIVFVVAEEFTRIILSRESGPFNGRDMVKELRQTFTTSRFQKIIDLLESLTF